MQIGVSSWTYAWTIGVAGAPPPPHKMDAMALLCRAHDLGADVLQIADNLPLDLLGAQELSALSRQARAWNIRLEVGTRGVRPAHLLRFLDITNGLESTLVRTLLHDAEGFPTMLEAERRLREILPALAARQLTLAIENHDLYPAAELRGLIERLDSPQVGVCLDPVNNLAQGESTTDVFTALADHAVNFHCKDYTIRRKPSNLGFDVEGCAVGDGLLNVPRCREWLGGRDMSYIVELWTPWQGDIASTCALEQDWAERSVAYLRRV